MSQQPAPRMLAAGVRIVKVVAAQPVIPPDVELVDLSSVPTEDREQVRQAIAGVVALAVKRAEAARQYRAADTAYGRRLARLSLRRNPDDDALASGLAATLNCHAYQIGQAAETLRNLAILGRRA